MTQITLNESQANALENELYRNYGIWGDVDKNIMAGSDEMCDYYYRIIVETDDGPNIYFVGMSILPDTIQDLLWLESD